MFEISALLGEETQMAGHAVNTARKKRKKNFLLIQDFTSFPQTCRGTPPARDSSRNTTAPLEFLGNSNGPNRRIQAK
jgi:hypothetical protein